MVSRQQNDALEHIELCFTLLREGFFERITYVTIEDISSRFVVYAYVLASLSVKYTILMEGTNSSITAFAPASSVVVLADYGIVLGTLYFTSSESPQRGL